MKEIEQTPYYLAKIYETICHVLRLFYIFSALYVVKALRVEMSKAKSQHVEYLKKKKYFCSLNVVLLSYVGPQIIGKRYTNLTFFFTSNIN